MLAKANAARSIPVKVINVSTNEMTVYESIRAAVIVGEHHQMNYNPIRN